MSKVESAKTVVFGGRNTVQQQYCGFVGGQAVDSATINSEIKTTKLKDHPPVTSRPAHQLLYWHHLEAQFWYLEP